jgi:serpin B
MNQQLEHARYMASNGWQRITLPYVGDELSMRIVVPTKPASSLRSLESALDAATKPNLTDPDEWVNLTLPKWDTKTDVDDLIPVLTELGMPDLFGARADLSGIAPGLSVDQVAHRATITVDEKGTEAAAVTGIGVATSARTGGPIEMRVDRPFAWAIVHEPTGTPVFTGHVIDPTG